MKAPKCESCRAIFVDARDDDEQDNLCRKCSGHRALKELRIAFESFAELNCQPISRDKAGRYKTNSTFLMWGAYFECASIYGVVVGDDARQRNKNTQ